MANDSNSGPLKELATSRARFIAELGDRVASIRHGLGRVGAGPEASGELNAVRRRLHALAAAADVLHFTAAADALRRAEVELGTLAGAPSAAPARERVARVLDVVPSLALGAPIDVNEELAGERARSPREPLCVLVFGDAALEGALHKPGPLHGVETHRTRDTDELLTLVTRLGPDVLVLDGDDERVVEFLPRLRQAAGSNPFPWVAVGNFESYEGMLRLIRRGISRVLPKPVDAAALQRTLRLLVPRELPAPPRPNPFEHMGPDGLVDVVAREARRAFVDPQSGTTHAPPLSTEAGNQALAALWSAFARIRVLATRASDPSARFPLEGPYGMIPLAPTLGAAASPHDSPVREALAGRRFVVADADPTLLGALSRSLQRLGASVLPARDGAQALELCERQWPDALISDALLPSVDGFELCRKVRDDIALGDLPVALICWKEHLLEHARRVSEQHGSEPRPLDPDAFLPLAEALAKRMTLERRLERHDAVHGRLDGLTPRLLLQLACSRTPSALLCVRSGRLAVEVAVVDGRPVHARLLDGQNVAAEGPAALGPLLGMRVGRFSMEPLGEAPPSHFSGDVMTVLAPTIARARRGRTWLLAGGVQALERVELEPRVTALYMEEAPAAHKALLTRLLRGESPRQLSGASEAPDQVDATPLTAALLELVRRGGVTALIDKSFRDVLEPDSSRTSMPPRGRVSEVPAVPLPAALSLAEAVLQAVSAPTDHAPDKPSARRTHPGLAPPSPPPEPHVPRRPSLPPQPDPRLTALRPSSIPPPPDSAPHPPAATASVSTTAPTLPPRSSRIPLEPRELAEAWSSEEHEDDDEPPASDPADGSSVADPEPRPSARARVGGVVGPLLVTLGAAALAFAGMRVLMGGSLDQFGSSPLSPAADNDPPSVPATPAPSAAPIGTSITSALPAPPLTPTPGAPAREASVDAGDATSPALSAPAARDVAPIVDVATEALSAPLLLKLPPGHGLLEVRTWEPQRIYVDGVFVGNYASRLVPLSPGTYQVRLLTGSRDIEQAAQIQSGRRTRIWARATSTE